MTTRKTSRATLRVLGLNSEEVVSRLREIWGKVHDSVIQGMVAEDYITRFIENLLSPTSAPSATVPDSLSTESSWDGNQPTSRMTDEDRSDLRAARKALKEPGRGMPWEKLKEELAAVANAKPAARKRGRGLGRAGTMKRKIAKQLKWFAEDPDRARGFNAFVMGVKPPSAPSARPPKR